MMRIRSNLSFANVVSMLALTIALGGTSYAATSLSKNSVGSTQIKSKAVKNSDLGDSSVTTEKVKDGSLLKEDFKPGQLPSGDKGATGDKGTKSDSGTKGDTGAKGDVGSIAAATVQYKAAVAVDLADGAKASYDVYCPDNRQAIAGGGRGDAQNSEEASVTSSRPAISSVNSEPPVSNLGFKGWRITVVNDAGGMTSGLRPEVWVVCVPAP